MGKILFLLMLMFDIYIYVCVWYFMGLTYAMGTHISIFTDVWLIDLMGSRRLIDRLVLIIMSSPDTDWDDLPLKITILPAITANVIGHHKELPAGATWPNFEDDPYRTKVFTTVSCKTVVGLQFHVSLPFSSYPYRNQTWGLMIFPISMSIFRSSHTWNFPNQSRPSPPPECFVREWPEISWHPGRFVKPGPN